MGIKRFFNAFFNRVLKAFFDEFYKGFYKGAFAFGLLLTSLASHADDSFSDYLARVKVEAVAAGISEKTIDNAFGGLERDERVIKFDQRQPEFVQTFDEYLQARVTSYRKTQGAKLYQQHRELLHEVAARYEVDPEYLVAFWGLETNFGRHQGKYSIIRSLATLGHNPRRSKFFTSELVQALKILDEGHIEPDQFVGAWAGAMGQGQFMPSSFLRYAQDFDGDGKKNIWSSQADVFASIANYLKSFGWVVGAGWGGAVALTELDFETLKPASYDTACRGLRHHSKKLSLNEWAELNLVPTSKILEQPYSLIEPEVGAAMGYLAGGNFRVILRYNCANKYAVSVGLLADEIRRQIESS